MFACFVDFQKAFDTAIHTRIKIKLLIESVLEKNSIKLLSKAFIHQVNLVFGSITDLRIFSPVTQGVKQGDNLSPNLLKNCINGPPDYLSSAADPVFMNSNPIKCLMYVDDIILLSSTAQGLQQELNISVQYCNDWCLSINTSKTKIIIFNKAGMLCKTKFYLADVEQECVQEYKYLGVTFCSSGSFSFAQKVFYQKALKSFFKLRKNFISMNPDIKTAIHIFDHTIKPILLYVSEIWG